MTPNWDFLLDEASLASILPAEFAHFTRPVRDGLSLFLGGLPVVVQDSILSAQAGLPPTASFSQRIGLLAQSSPVLQKLGQVLARDPRLSPLLRRYLRELESLPPSLSLETIRNVLVQELGSLDRRGVTLLPPAIAEASVAVVIPFRQDPSAGQPVSEGVFKVLKPGIEEQLDLELTLLERVGEQLDARCDELGIPHLDYEESFQQVRHKLMDEIALENEQRHLVAAQAFFADEPRVKIPVLLDHCTSRVTSMERISGGKVTDHRLSQPRQKHQLAKLIGRALIAKPIFSLSRDAMFHGDPHAGNLFLTDDGRLAILDWSLVGSLGASERIAIVQILLGAITLDADRIAQVLINLANPGNRDPDRVRHVAESWIKRVRGGQFPGLSWLVGLLDDSVQDAGLRFPVDMMLFRKSLHTLKGVIADVGECEGQLDRTLSMEFVRHFAAEWPGRWLTLPHSRNFATRLSNLDVTQTVFSVPATLTRFWTGNAIDILDAWFEYWGPRPAECPANNRGVHVNPIGDQSQPIRREPGVGKPLVGEPDCGDSAEGCSMAQIIGEVVP